MIVHPLFADERTGALPRRARELEFSECAIQLAQELNRQWHSVLPETDLGNLVRNRRAIAFAAFFANWYYAAAIWTDPIAANRFADGDRMLELRRYAIAPKAPRNTATRMLGYMRRAIHARWPELTRLVSYQAKEHHTGTIYKADNWRPTAENVAKVWHAGKQRAPMQTTSDKVRWEKEL